jgi:hypothetical protein
MKCNISDIDTSLFVFLFTVDGKLLKISRRDFFQPSELLHFDLTTCREEYLPFRLLVPIARNLDELPNVATSIHEDP